MTQGGGRSKASVRYLNLCGAAKTIAEKMGTLVELVVLLLGDLTGLNKQILLHLLRECGREKKNHTLVRAIRCVPLRLVIIRRLQ